MTNKINEKVTDPDLVELAGLHVYQNPQIYDDPLEVNGKTFRVLDTRYDHPSGLDAMTVKCLETGEISVIYQGTQADAKYGKQDLKADAQLLSDLDVEQLDAAEEYYVEMKERYEHEGGVSYVAGNSLGGPLASNVVVEHPEDDIRCVTLNPALLPKGKMDPNREYSNIVNYFGSNDVLTKGLISLGLDDRIPGERRDISFGAPYAGLQFNNIGPFHTGYYGNNKPYVVAGEKINVSADDHIISSIWTGEPLYSGNTERIDITPEALDKLSNALIGDDLSVHGKYTSIDSYMNKSKLLVEQEGERFSARLNELQDKIEEITESHFSHPLFKGISTLAAPILLELDIWIALLGKAESFVRSINKVLDSPPLELVEHIININLNVANIFEPPRELLSQFKENIVDLLQGFKQLSEHLIPTLLSGGKQVVEDVFVNDLNAHYKIVNLNIEKVSKHIELFNFKTNFVRAEMVMRDKNLADSITNKGSLLAVAPSMLNSSGEPLTESDHMLVGMKLGDLILDESIAILTAFGNNVIQAVVGTLIGIVSALEGSLEATILQIKSKAKIDSVAIPMDFLGLYSNLANKVNAIAESAIAPLEEITGTLGGVRDGLTRVFFGFPNIVNEFKPFLQNAILDQFKLAEINILNGVSSSLHGELELLFEDIIYQLSEHKGNSITALHDTSQKVKADLETVREQIERITFS
ncbi:SA1320 family protein [Rossellomorea sp. H39__3]